MESQKDLLDLETGTKEVTSLKPKKVKIVEMVKKEVGEKKNLKMAFKVKHPDKEDLVEISSVKLENKGKLEVVGLWINLDEDGLLRKGSALAKLIAFSGSITLREMKDKEIDTTEDARGYLCFKAY